jgi:hypothetical protein
MDDHRCLPAPKGLLRSYLEPVVPGGKPGGHRHGRGRPGLQSPHGHRERLPGRPQKGATLSFAFITLAVAGPFDLGNVVVRAAAFVNPITTQVTVKTDPIPQILDGVPLGVRSIQVKVDKPSFTLNPTNCEPMAVGAQVGGASGASASPANHFQAGDCGALGFAPKLKLALKGQTGRTGNPAVKASLPPRPARPTSRGRR